MVGIESSSDETRVLVAEAWGACSGPGPV